MRRGPRKSPYRAAVAALRNGIAARLKLNAADESLIADLLARDGDNAAAITAVITAVPPKKRRRRRRRAVHAKTPANGRRKPRSARPVVAIAQPTPVIAAAEPKPAVRGASKYAELLGELEMIRVGISAGDANAIHKLQVRGDAILREMAGKARLPPWLNKAERMRWRRCADRAPRTKRPRKPTPKPEPPVRHDSGWHEDGQGNLVREIASQ
jgi:hypothetical protein